MAIEKLRSCLKALMLCYSNRAATRISLGRMKKALGDCLMAPNIDPVFLKAQVRAAQKVITEAFEGLEKAQQIYEFNNDSLIFATPVEPSTLAVVPSEVNCLLTPIGRCDELMINPYGLCESSGVFGL
ncbi:hypothetical protein CTI12_AA586160 [Artemisia annua]|uniref:Uncharacterized protein n=1 Tax=Artemisia annua TaxID=35608 RepID=A0A2U1KMJ5_ARTAN|nr:hypothetical protein CTI12_AA586160 [Artemisia annua]